MNFDRVKLINRSELESGVVPEWVEMLPSGPVVKGRDGRAFFNTKPEKIIEAFQANKAPLPIDIEHATEVKATNGEPAPAVGWMEELENRGGAIWARVDWTEEGKKLIGSRAYRFLSPVLLCEKETKTVLAIDSAGLTNKHNLHLTALNHEQKGTTMKDLLKFLGLDENASEEAAINAVKKIQGDLETATNRAKTPDLEKFVPKADYAQAMTRASNAEAKLEEKNKAELETSINAEIDAALKAGKIAPASKDFYVAMCQMAGGLDKFKDFVKTAPVIAKDSGLDGKDPVVDPAKALNAEEKKIAAMFGNSENDLKKHAN